MLSTNPVQNAVIRFRGTSADLWEYAKLNRNEKIFNDVTLQVSNLSIGANRMVLACCSTYFETMFKSNAKKRFEPIIPIDGVDSKTAVTLVDYMYNGQIIIDNDSALNILAGADYFQLYEVKQFCLEFLLNRITLDNWYAVQAAAKLYRSEQLQKQVNEFITDHFDEIIHSIAFITFSKHDLVSFVSNLNRNQICEPVIYQAIMDWVKHGEQERKKEFPDLFQLIEINKLSSDELQNISTEPLIQVNVTCAKSVMLLLSKLMTEIKIKQNESKIIMTGGIPNSKKVTEIFNCNGVEPKKYPDLPFDVLGHCLLKLNDVIFCIGGKSLAESPDIYNKVCHLKLNDTNLKWSDAVPMNEKRALLGAAVFRDHLVVAGGRKGDECLTSTEYFDGLSGKWQMGPSMQRRKYSFCLVECNDNLFAFGGNDREEYLSCVERLQSFNGQWEFVAPMLTKRFAAAGVSLDGYIYAIGGQSKEYENSGQKTVERYDPKLNEWSYVSKMNFVRSWASACVLNGRIFVAGGWDVDGKLVKDIECYDPSEDKWEIVQFSWKNETKLGGVLIVI